MDRGAWRAAARRVAESRTQLSDSAAAAAAALAWKIPWRAEPGWLQSMGLQRVGRDQVPMHTHIQHQKLQ